MQTNYEIKNKSKFKPLNTGFCNYVLCMKEVQLKENGTCIRCGSPVSKKDVTYEATLNRFEKILEQITPALYDHVFSERELNGLKIPVQIGTGNKDFFFIPLRYFVEYLNLKHTEDYKDDKKAVTLFMKHVMSVSPKVRL